MSRRNNLGIIRSPHDVKKRKRRPRSLDHVSWSVVGRARASVCKKMGAPIMFHPCERDFLGKMTSPVDLGVKHRVHLRQ